MSHPPNKPRQPSAENAADPAGWVEHAAPEPPGRDRKATRPVGMVGGPSCRTTLQSDMRAYHTRMGHSHHFLSPWMRPEFHQAGTDCLLITSVGVRLQGSSKFPLRSPPSCHPMNARLLVRPLHLHRALVAEEPDKLGPNASHHAGRLM
jgi:hypothetical protein